MDEDKTCFIIYYTSIHWSIKVQDHFKKKAWSIIFLPQYAPELAPVELFFCILKKRILARRTNELINLEKKKSGMIMIENVAESIDRITIMRI